MFTCQHLHTKSSNANMLSRVDLREDQLRNPLREAYLHTCIPQISALLFFLFILFYILLTYLCRCHEMIIYFILHIPYRHTLYLFFSLFLLYAKMLMHPSKSLHICLLTPRKKKTKLSHKCISGFISLLPLSRSKRFHAYINLSRESDECNQNIAKKLCAIETCILFVDKRIWDAQQIIVSTSRRSESQTVPERQRM